MMWKKTGKLLLSIFFILNLLPAAQVEFSAAVDKKTVPLNQTLTLTLTVDGSINVPGITLPEFEGFNIIGQSSSTRLQMVNGNQYMTKVFSYALSPTSKGEHTIPSMSLKFANNTYSTDPIKIKVTDPVKPAQTSRKRQASSSFFDLDHFMGSPPANRVLVNMTTSKKSLYVGEKSIININVYFKRPFYDGPVFDFPELKGFIVKDIPVNKQPIATNYQDEKFALITATKEITPVDNGKFTIEGATVRYVENTFSGIKAQQTNGINLTVRSLPHPQPENFSGAVGDFDISAKLLQQKQQYLQGEAIPLKISITGQGNLDVVNDLQLPEFEGFDLYLDTINDNQDKEVLTKSFTYQITPLLVSGQIKLPDIKFTIFDPSRKSYQTKRASLPAIVIQENRSLNFQSRLQQQELVSDNALVIKLDKNLLAKILKMIGLISGLILGVLLIIFLSVNLLKRLFSVKSSLNKDLKTLEKLENNQFLAEAKNILNSYFNSKFKLNLAGVASSDVPQIVKDQVTAQKIVSLMTIFEQYQYSTAQSLKSEDKKMISSSLNELIQAY